MKKANRQAAVSWQKEQQEREMLVGQLDDATTNLHYAAHKTGTNIPSAEVFERAGRPDVAALIRQARNLYCEAHALLVSPKCGTDKVFVSTSDGGNMNSFDGFTGVVFDGPNIQLG